MKNFTGIFKNCTQSFYSIYLLLLCIGFSQQSSGQTQATMSVRGTINSFGNNAMTYRSSLAQTWIATVQANTTNASAGFLFANNGSFNPKWARGAAVSFNSQTTWFASGGDGTYNQTNGNFYTFICQDQNGGTNSKGYLFETSAAPVSVSTVAQSPLAASVTVGQSVTVTATTSASLPTGQGVFLRYSTNAFSTSTVVSMTGSGTTYTASIPGNTNTAGANVVYYVFTSGGTSAPAAADCDLATINLNNNSGSNYSYTVKAWTTAANGNWSNAATWISNTVPPTGTNLEAVTIAHNVTQDQNAIVSSITINGSRTLTASANTLTISNNSSTTTFSNSGTLAASGTHTVIFAGTGTHTISGSQTFQNVTTSTGVNFGSNSTIAGSFLLNAGGFASTNAPSYGSSSTLIYNATNYGRGLEWSTISGAGYPANVQIGNGVNTTFDVVNGSNSYKRASGTLTVISGSTFSIPALTSGTGGVGVEFLGNIINDGTISLNTGANTTSQRLKGVTLTNGNSNATATVNLSGAIGGDLELTGNYVDNAVFTANARAVFFTGTGVQTIGGTATAPFNIDYIVVTKASGSVQLLTSLLTGALNGGNGLTLSTTNDIFDLNGRTLTLGTGSQTCTVSGSGVIRSSSTTPGSMIINGTGAMGTLNFESGNNTLAGLTINRTAGTGTPGLTLGSALTVNTTLSLNSAATLTLGGNLNVSATGNNSIAGIIAGTGALVKTGAGTLTLSAASGNNTAHTYSAGTTINGAGTGTISVTGLTNITTATITSSAQSVTFSTTTPSNGTYQLLPGTLTVDSQSFTHNADATKAVTFNYTNSTVTVGTATITTGTVTPTTYCAGTSVSVPFTTTGTLTGTYTAQLSDASGSFASPVAIGTGTASPISATFSGGTATGAGYRIRVVSLTIPITGSNNGSNIAITTAPNAGTLSGTNAICSNSSTTFISSGYTGGTFTSGTPAVATVDASTGVITPLSAGTSLITYTITGAGGCANATATRTVTVTTAPNAGTLSGTNVICSNGSTTFATSGDTGGTFTTGTPAVATVDASTGVITPLTAGTSLITYTVIGVGGCANATATRTVTVTTAPNAGTLSGTNAMCSNDSTTFTTSGDTGGTFTSGTPAVATVDASTGAITPLTAGSSLITYTVIGVGGCANATATRTVTVTAAPYAGTLSGTNAICSNGSTTFITNGDTGGTFTSGTPAVATVDAATGLITPLTAGSSLITYTVIGVGGCANATATRTVTVTAAPNAGTISGNQTITTGTTPTNIILSNYTGSIQWQSSLDGVTFSNISGATNPTLLGTTIDALTEDRYIRAVVTSGSCGSVNSSVSTITITCCKFKFSSN